MKPYSVLAAGYDLVMAHVDYESWAAYIDELISRYRNRSVEAIDLLELGCGTGSFGFEFQHLGGYRYRGLDASREMVHIARHKAEVWGEPIDVETKDFLTFSEDQTCDVVVLLYDGVNYLLELDQVSVLVRNVFHCLRPGGLFLMDQSTPANSENNRDYFEDRGSHEDFSYWRQSEYDAKSALHRTRFEFSVRGETYVEEHLQRAYSVDQISTVVADSEFEQVACFEGFSSIQATEDSERVQWILRRPM